MAFASHISKFTLVPYYILAPVMVCLIFFATFNINRDWYDFIGLLGFGLIGITFKNFGWSRPALLIGFFLSTKVELLSYQTHAVYGLSFLYRPVSIVLTVLCFLTILLLLRQRFESNYSVDLAANKLGQVFYVLVLMCLPLSMIWITSNLDYRANLFPISLSIIAAILLNFILCVKIADLKQLKLLQHPIMNFARSNIFEITDGFNKQFHYYVSFLGFLFLNFIFGFPIASALFINLFILFHDRKAYRVSLSISAILLVILWMLSSLLTLQFPNGAIGFLIELPWWLGGLY